MRHVFVKLSDGRDILVKASLEFGVMTIQGVVELTCPADQNIVGSPVFTDEILLATANLLLPI